MTLRRTLQRSLSTTTRGLLQFGSGGGVAPLPPLLDTYPGAAAAYSLRKLSSSYSGSAIRVRRASDSAEQDIGFSGNDLDTASLTSFCTGTNGFVTTWYDQSGGGNDATQATTTNQPLVVSSGAVITKGAKPCVQIATTNASGSVRLQTSAFSSAISQPITVFSAFNQETVDDRQTLFDGREVSLSCYYFTAGYIQNAGSSLSVTSSTTGQKISYSLYNTISSEFSINNSTPVTGDNGSNQLDGVSIGNARGVPSPIVTNYMFIGQIHELIFYSADQSSNRTGIQNDISNYYGITLP